MEEKAIQMSLGVVSQIYYYPNLKFQLLSLCVELNLLYAQLKFHQSYPSVPALLSVAQLRAARNDVIHAGRERRLRRDEQAQATDLLSRPHPAHDLRGLAFGAAALRVCRGVNRLLPERRVAVARRDCVDAHTA